MNNYRICDKCKGFNYKFLLDEIKKIDKDSKIEIGCQNFCGIGRSKAFVILNDKPIICSNEKELIDKIKMQVSK